MIILTIAQKNAFNILKENYRAKLNSKSVDIIPIEAKNDVWILPDSVLTNPAFADLYSELNIYPKRNIDKSELKTNKKII
jgi:hypothetical protein